MKKGPDRVFALEGGFRSHWNWKTPRSEADDVMILSLFGK